MSRGVMASFVAKWQVSLAVLFMSLSICPCCAHCRVWFSPWWNLFLLWYFYFDVGTKLDHPRLLFPRVFKTAIFYYFLPECYLGVSWDPASLHIDSAWVGVFQEISENDTKYWCFRQLSRKVPIFWQIHKYFLGNQSLSQCILTYF
jgi:hypothetical protein